MRTLRYVFHAQHVPGHAPDDAQEYYSITNRVASTLDDVQIIALERNAQNGGGGYEYFYQWASLDYYRRPGRKLERDVCPNLYFGAGSPAQTTNLVVIQKMEHHEHYKTRTLLDLKINEDEAYELNQNMRIAFFDSLKLNVRPRSEWHDPTEQTSIDFLTHYSALLKEASVFNQKFSVNVVKSPCIFDCYAKAFEEALKIRQSDLSLDEKDAAYKKIGHEQLPENEYKTEIEGKVVVMPDGTRIKSMVGSNVRPVTMDDFFPQVS
jgi:hypothetical protein